LPFRYRGSRRESAVAQLFSLGGSRMCKSKQLQKAIEDSLVELENKTKEDSHPYAITGFRHIAIVLSASAQLAEISTRRIVYLTVMLLLFTIGLFVYTILLYQTENAHDGSTAKTDHHQNQTNFSESKP
jgi:hypothetical protein